MKRQIITSTFLVCVLVLPGSFLLAADQDRKQTQDQVQIYGSQLMTEQERNEYRNQIRSAKTAKERKRIRSEHHQAMTERAKKQGVTLPDEPPAMKGHRGMGSGDRDRMRPGDGTGPRGGMGSGGAMGGGPGR